MVSLRWSGLLAHAALSCAVHPKHSFWHRDQSLYQSWSRSGIEALQSQGWYDEGSGLWRSTLGSDQNELWWNSANVLTMLADYAYLDQSGSAALGIASLIDTTWTNAQKQQVQTAKIQLATGIIKTTTTTSTSRVIRSQLEARGNPDFLNTYYDDEGWWGLGFIRAYDTFGKSEYVEQAQRIFADMQGGVDTTCGGGIWWSKDRTYKNAIANELFLMLAAHLATRTSNGTSYLAIAEQQWAWFKNSGMINVNGTVNDGLSIVGSDANATCTNNGMQTWSYNQGVVLGGLAELYNATGNTTYLTEAAILVNASIALLSDGNGVIHEWPCEPDCSGDAAQFKGVYARNLGYLYHYLPWDNIKRVLVESANSIWNNSRNTSTNMLGVVWTGSVDAGGVPNAVTQSSALDAIVAALTVSGA